MPIKICDALCGSGKTSACIHMINTDSSGKYMFVTQYLTEVDRIARACPNKKFEAPAIDSDGTTKMKSLRKLLRAGANIATTHALFLNFTDEIRNLIRRQGYTLILDEVVETLTEAKLSRSDLDILRRSGVVRNIDDSLVWVDEGCADEGGRFFTEMNLARSKNFVSLDGSFYFWSISSDIFRCFSDVYILTYLFQSQSMYYFLNMNNLPFEYIGVRKADDGYIFCPADEMDRTRRIKDKIQILDNGKMNAIGKARGALSASWYESSKAKLWKGDIDLLRRNISNYFKNILKSSSKDCLWTSFKKYRQDLSGRGYSNAFIPYNLRASNEFADRHNLAFCLNVFPRPMEVRYYNQNGIKVNGDMFALSTLVQWIFRSAIRNGEKIQIYIPSARMRYILETWMDNLESGRDLEEIHYTSPSGKINEKKENKKK